LSVAFRKFGEESIQFLGKKVSIETSDKKTYSGTLIGINERLDIILEDLETSGIIKIIINGSFIKEIRLMEKPFDLKALAEEGTGLAADRIKAIYDEFIRETKK
jgi:small nuclear ribonucleoprotein (snRNP)-like protein